MWNLYDRGITTPFEVGILLWKRRLREKPELLQKADLDAFHVPKRVDTVLRDDRFELTVDVNSVHDELERAIEELHERLSL